MNKVNIARLLISCQDKKGIVAQITNFLFQEKCNIIQSDQYSTDYQNGIFFMRIEFAIEQKDFDKKFFEANFLKIAKLLKMTYSLTYANIYKKTAIFVSKYTHCLLDLLWQWKNQELDMDLKLIISNHNDASNIAKEFNLPFFYLPVSPENKISQEKEMLKILKKFKIDFIVLARYMQILSNDFIKHYPQKIINIHHSFLPAFAGAKPYHKAFARGVKIIGATAHYATKDLDEGPIIEQDVIRVSHKESLNDLEKNGKEIERSVLTRAVKWHLEDRVITYKNKTIVF